MRIRRKTDVETIDIIALLITFCSYAFLEFASLNFFRLFSGVVGIFLFLLLLVSIVIVGLSLLYLVVSLNELSKFEIAVYAFCLSFLALSLIYSSSSTSYLYWNKVYNEGVIFAKSKKILDKSVSDSNFGYGKEYYLKKIKFSKEKKSKYPFVLTLESDNSSIKEVNATFSQYRALDSSRTILPEEKRALEKIKSGLGETSYFVKKIIRPLIIFLNIFMLIVFLFFAFFEIDTSRDLDVSLDSSSEASERSDEDSTNQEDASFKRRITLD